MNEQQKKRFSHSEKQQLITLIKYSTLFLVLLVLVIAFSRFSLESFEAFRSIRLFALFGLGVLGINIFYYGFLMFLACLRYRPRRTCRPAP